MNVHTTNRIWRSNLVEAYRIEIRILRLDQRTEEVDNHPVLQRLILSQVPLDWTDTPPLQQQLSNQCQSPTESSQNHYGNPYRSQSVDMASNTTENRQVK